MIPVLFGLKVLKNFKRDFMCMFVFACVCLLYCVWGPEEAIRFPGTGQLCLYVLSAWP